MSAQETHHTVGQARHDDPRNEHAQHDHGYCPRDAHIHQCRNQRSRPCAGARQRNCHKQQQTPQLIFLHLVTFRPCFAFCRQQRLIFCPIPPILLAARVIDENSVQRPSSDTAITFRLRAPTLGEDFSLSPPILFNRSSVFLDIYSLLFRPFSGLLWPFSH